MKIKYTYDRYDGSAPGGNNYCSNHHILPYHVMYLIGIICLALAKKKEESDTYDYYSKLLELSPNAGNLDNTINDTTVNDDFEYVFPQVSQTLIPGTRTVQTSHTSLPTVIGAISWLEYNIFKGPRGLSRSDDPSQLGEKVKPASFPKARWEKLDSLLKMYSTIGKKSAATKGDTLNYTITYTQAKSIAQAFLNTVSGSTLSHQTVVGDWVLGDTTTNRYKFIVDLKNPVEYNKILTSTEVKNTILPTFKFACGANIVPVPDVYMSIVKVDRSTGKIFAVKRSGEPPQEKLQQQFEPLFDNY